MSSNSEECGLKTNDVSFLDELIERFMHALMKRDEAGVPTAEMQVSIAPAEVYRLCQLAINSFKQQPALVRIQR
jgi:hypothetical protein